MKQDDHEAVRLYRLAADQAFAPAQVWLGYMYERGRGGLAIDRHEALRCYRQAAQQGNEIAKIQVRALSDN